MNIHADKFLKIIFLFNEYYQNQKCYLTNGVSDDNIAIYLTINFIMILQRILLSVCTCMVYYENEPIVDILSKHLFLQFERDKSKLAA